MTQTSHAWSLIGDLYENRFDQLASQAYRLVGPDAEDIVHSVFIRAADLASEGKPLEEIALMLTAMVRNKSIDHLRKFPREEDYRDEVDRGLDMTLEAWLFSQDFNEALYELTPTQARAFILTEVRGLSTVEAATVVGVTQQSIHEAAELGRKNMASLIR
jgi:RNA polymerase sigma factor (sigma-70 family)